MSWTAFALASVALAVALFFLAIAVAAGSRLSRVSLRAIAEKRSDPVLLQEIARKRSSFLLPLETALQALLILFTLMTAFFLRQQSYPLPELLAAAAMIVLNVVFAQLLPKLIVQLDAEATLLRTLRMLRPIYPALKFVSWPLRRLIQRGEEYREKSRPQEEEEEEAGDEEIQAYIGVGAEEGIFEHNETELIQSALEFGTTSVRETMTPRTEVVAVPLTATIAQLRELFIEEKHSRLPVYGEGMDDIVGVVYLRNFLTHLFRDKPKENDPIGPIVNDVPLVAETKLVSELLKEFQRTHDNMAIVVDEYGAVSGLVTTEDLVEEIVGEIRDEDEGKDTGILLESDGSIIVEGGVELERLGKVLKLDFDEDEVSTISGLVVTKRGEVPAEGETFQFRDFEFEVLEANGRRISSMRIRRLPDADSAARSRLSESASNPHP